MIGLRHLRRAACAATILIAAAGHVYAAGEFRTIEGQGLRITVDSEWVPNTARGYFPVRWDITNLGDERTIEIAGDGNRTIRRSYRSGQSRPSVRQRVRLAAGDRVRFTMNVPTSGEIDNMRFQIRENGRVIQQLGYVNSSGTGDGSALIVVAPNSPYAGEAAGWVRRSRYSVRTSMSSATIVSTGRGISTAPMASVPAGATGGPLVDITLDPIRVPSSWLGYTSVEAVFIGASEWEQMDGPQRTALLTWTAAGGNLVLVDTQLDTLFPDARYRPAAEGEVAEHFFGRIHRLSSKAISSAGLESTLTSVLNFREPVWSLPLEPVPAATSGGGFRIPIPGVNAVPTGAYLTLLVLFTVLIGPVNHVVLKRRGQQALTVLTTPVIAAIFILLLGGYVALVEGFAVHGRALTVTILDQGTGQAATRASVSLYAAGRSPSDGLRFARDVAVFPTPLDGSPPIGEALDLTETQQFSSGLLPARTPTNFETVSFRTARERLNMSRQGNQLHVSNGLDATVTRLRYRDATRSYELAEPLPPGGAAVLRETSASVRELLSGGDSALSRFDGVVSSLPEGAYLAILDRSPFWDGGTSGINERASFHLVLGRPGALP